MADLNVDSMLLNYKERSLEEKITLWKITTRLLFKRFPSPVIYHLVDEALAEASDEQWFKNKYPKWIFKEEPPKAKMEMSEYKGMRELINKKIKITDIAKTYGLEIHGTMCVCPFHADTKPSLSLSDEKNVFYCFGCHIKGDVIKFIGLLEDEKKRGRIKGT